MEMNLRFSEDEMVSALIALRENEKPVYGFFAAFFALIPAVSMYFLFADMGGALYVMFAIPPAMVGFAARFVGRSYKFKHRLPVGFLGVFAHLVGCYLLSLNPFLYLMAPVAFVISASVAKVKLERVHIWALDQEEMGKINTNKQLNRD
ncbi:hypothetical protein PP2015_2271 [Pseudoalteromonas phenolica]|uniref:Uncharacterized protein n=1 Tax=Pseudoalteromonas phenolica TaxID=161398 RepID=A0A0S2K2Z4_9GAMM|nr:hypothetical protein PP2015_2271 [Pseudoalteromonas phenolica]